MSFPRCPKCGKEALEIKKDESIKDYYICINCGHIFKDASISKKELKFGQWAWVWNNGGKKEKQIYIGFDGEYHWAVIRGDERDFKEKVLGKFVRIVAYEHAEPYKPEIDWDKVPRNVKVLISYDGEKWKEAYFCAFLECAEDPYLVFIDHDTCQYVWQDVATGAVGAKYCKFPDDFEIPEEWLEDDGC